MATEQITYTNICKLVIPITQAEIAQGVTPWQGSKMVEQHPQPLIWQNTCKRMHTSNTYTHCINLSETFFQRDTRFNEYLCRTLLLVRLSCVCLCG